MQTKFFLILITGLLYLNVHAQTQLGIRGGISLATITDIQEELDPDFELKSITGLNLALFAELSLTDRLAIQPEVNFLQKGSTVEASFVGNADVKIEARINYLEVPVLAKYKFGSDKLGIQAFAGPSIGYALSGRAKTTLAGVEATEKIEFDNDIDDDGVKDQRWDLSAVLGLSGSMSAGPGQIVLDIRYAMDFTDFTKFKDTRPDDYQKSYNRVLGISLGYQIPLNTK